MKYTTLATSILQNAFEYAQSHEHTLLHPAHLMYALIHNAQSKNILKSAGFTLESLTEHARKEERDIPKGNVQELALAESMQKVLHTAHDYARRAQDTHCGIDALVYGIAWYAQKQYHTDMNLAAIESMLLGLRKGSTMNNPQADSTTNILETYTKNITKEARDGKLDPVIGRHEEIRRVLQILSRRTKNNPILLGEPGVGKTAIVEGIAQRIINNDVPENLKNAVIYSLDIGLLMAGTKYQGEFEQRIKGIIEALENSSNHAILFIDEIHMIVGAGSTGGALDVSNLLKPALARGSLHCIGATTLKEYKLYFEKDAALERRFQPVTVPEPTIDDTISILRGLKERYEMHHGIQITDQALVSAARLAALHITDRFLPDKAIDLVDEAAAAVKMAMDAQPEEIDRLLRTIGQLEIEKFALAKEKDPASQERLKNVEKELQTARQNYDELMAQWKAERAPLEHIQKLKTELENAQHAFETAQRSGDYGRASEIKYGTIARLEKELSEAEKESNGSRRFIKDKVTQEDIAKVVSRWTGIPTTKLTESDAEALKSLPQTLAKRVIGQHEAVETVAKAIQTHRMGLADPRKPIGSFLFIGPTGVGKTEVARTLADVVFHDPQNFIRIDMSEYMEKHAVARLIGAPPGYAGYEEGGQLTQAVRKRPYSVILFDEVEKAHPDVFNIFLQILDDGQLTDSQGRLVSFKNTIIILTSNIGSEFMYLEGRLDTHIKEKVMERVRHNFKPEFLNRIDNIVFFDFLTQDDVEKIAYLQVDNLIKTAAMQDKEIIVDPCVYTLLAEQGYEPEYGARPLKRTIQTLITYQAAEFFMNHPAAKSVHITCENKIIVAKEHL